MRAAATVHDPALPHMPLLLEAGAMAPVLERSLGRPARVTGVRGRYLRYKPGTNLRVHYEVLVDGRREDAVVMIAAQADLARRARKAQNLALARAVDGRAPAAEPLSHDPQLGALVQWLPLDLALPGMVEPPVELRRRLRSAGVEVAASGGEPPRLAYKPHRRAVLRVDGHVVKAFATEQRYRAAEARLRAAGSSLGVPTAHFEAALPELRVTAQPFLEGRAPASAMDVARIAGAALREVHASKVAALDRFPPARQQEIVAGFGEVVAAVVPGLRARVDRLVARLEESLPRGLPVFPSHGDFHEGQLLLRAGDVAVIDFDEMTAAPAALDLATYAAHQLWGDEGDQDTARAVLEELVEGYGRRPVGLDWYLSALILRRASHPFRRMREDWPVRVETMLRAAEEALGP
jgi:thiamine kinase-like enzyme